eukprot:1865607-Rhodomonas_salina.3
MSPMPMTGTHTSYVSALPPMPTGTKIPYGSTLPPTLSLLHTGISITPNLVPPYPHTLAPGTARLGH